MPEVWVVQLHLFLKALPAKVDIRYMVDPCFFGEHLVAILNNEKTALVKCDPPILDFTRLSDSFLSVITSKASIKLPMNEQLDSFLGLLALTVFTPDRTVVGWDIKSVLAYFKMHGKPESYASLYLGRIVDLKLCETFLGIGHQAPKTWAEAMKRLKVCTEHQAAWKTHLKIHVPLATKVMPDIETCGVVDSWQKKTLYPSYTIEGQVHGRMSCHLGFDRAINPHSLVDEQRTLLKPKYPYTHFLQFDYRANEVVILQWLSKDPRLGEIIADPAKDLYEEVFKLVTDSPGCSKDERELAKMFLLPVFFGMQSYALSERLGVSKQLAQQIIELIGQKFPIAWSWVQEQHNKAEKTGKVVDYFGRVREVEEPYLARHFSIAAPATAICLERLVHLHKILPADKSRIVFSIHDAYVIATKRDYVNEVVKITRKALENETSLCPGLLLRTSCEAGKNLSKMTKLY